MKKFNNETVEIYNHFKEQVGSESGAQFFSIQNIKDICHEIKPKRVLEMGGGIGTLSYTILSNSNAFLDIYEQNSFCRSRLEENLKQFQGRYQIINTYRMLPPSREYDLMIIDGGAGKGRDKGYFQSAWFFLSYIQSIKIVYVEGRRRLQRIWARKALRQRYIYKLTKYDKKYNKAEDVDEKSQEGLKIGGLKIECRPSKFRLLRLINYFFWEIREVTLFKYFILYRIKKIKLFLNYNLPRRDNKND